MIPFLVTISCLAASCPMHGTMHVTVTAKSVSDCVVVTKRLISEHGFGQLPVTIKCDKK